MKVIINVEQCSGCPLYRVEGMEHMMLCGHPQLMTMSEQAIITQDNRYKIPEKCPLREDSLIQTIRLHNYE